MSVADILQQMAQNAGRAQLARGAILGNTIADVSHIPGQILDDRERQRIIDDQRARQRAQDARATAADARAGKDQALQDAAAQRDLDHRAAVSAGLAAAIGDSGDPTHFDAHAAFAAVSKLGKPEVIRDVIAAHRELTQVTQQDPTKDTYVNGVLTKPAAPKAMTPAEQAQRDETARHNKESERISALTEGRTEAAQKETARHNRAMEATAARTADPFGGQAGATGVDLEKLPAPVRDQAKALVEGRRQLDPRLASKPFGQTIINAAYAMDPTFDQANYNARAKTRTDLTNPGGTGGKTIGALNTAIQHAGKLSDLIEKLDNYESPLANAVVNPLRTATGSTAVTNYDTVAPQLAKEIERVWRGAGGTAGEIHDLIETIGHNKGKQQQREALQQFVDLAKGKLDSLEQQRDNVMGKTAGATIPILFESNKPIIEQIAQRAGASTSATGGSAPKDGDTKPIDGFPGTEQTFKNGKWIRTK